MKVGVLGGAFDPPHVGHLIIAEGMRDRLALDRVLFIPYAQGPHRSEGPAASGEHRLAMLRIALEGHDVFEADGRELERGGVSYTVDTLRSLTAEMPQAEIFLLMGSDQARTLPEWKESEAILGMARIAVAIRPGHSPQDLPQPSAIDLVSVDIPLVLVSSTTIRDRAARGLSIRYLVPPGVADYIQEHVLYR